jgi:sugar phosphate permease
MLCSVAAGVVMGLSSAALAFGVLFFVQGLAQSTGWAPLSRISAISFRAANGEWRWDYGTNYAVGGLVASIFAGYVGQQFGWRYAFVLPAAALFIIWILFLILQRDRPEDVGLPPIEAYHGEAPSRLETAASNPGRIKPARGRLSSKCYATRW